MKKLKRWQLMMIAPVYIPLHDLAVLTGRIADWWYMWTTENTAEEYILPTAVRHLFSRKPNKALSDSDSKS